MPTPRIATTSRPCPECGYDLRATQAAICPECGTELGTEEFPRISERADSTDAIAESLDHLRTGVIWTLLIWLGCIAVPFVGQVAWVVLVLVSGWRALALHRLQATEFWQKLQSAIPKNSWQSLMWAELALAVLGGGATLVVSSAEVPPPLVVILSLLRVAWMGLVTVNNLFALNMAVAVVKRSDEAPLEPFFQAGPLVTLGAPLLFLPLLALEASQPFFKTFPQWIMISVGLVTVAGCVAGVVSIVMIHLALVRARDAATASPPPRRPSPQHGVRKVHPPPPIPDAPPLAGDGDVIPFAQEPDDPPS